MIRFLAALILVLAAPLVAAFATMPTLALVAVGVIEVGAVLVLLEALGRRAGRDAPRFDPRRSAARDYGYRPSARSG